MKDDPIPFSLLNEVAASAEAVMLKHAESVCCFGAANAGPSGCTCWRLVPDQEQCKPQRGAAIPLRATMCDDCAYRPDSPEMRGEDRLRSRRRELLDAPAAGKVFYCHKGFATASTAVHETTGEERPTGRYIPPTEKIEEMLVCYDADGTPSSVCAGWLHRRRQYIATSCQSPEEV